VIPRVLLELLPLEQNHHILLGRPTAHLQEKVRASQQSLPKVRFLQVVRSFPLRADKDDTRVDQGYPVPSLSVSPFVDHDLLERDFFPKSFPTQDEQIIQSKQEYSQDFQAVQRRVLVMLPVAAKLQTKWASQASGTLYEKHTRHQDFQVFSARGHSLQ
jgi:hypothetical protein